MPWLLQEVFSWAWAQSYGKSSQPNSEPGHVSAWLKMVLIKPSMAFISVVKMNYADTNKHVSCQALQVEKYEGNHKLYNYGKAQLLNHIAWLKNICDHTQHDKI